VTRIQHVSLDGAGSLTERTSGRTGQLHCLFSSTRSMKLGSGMRTRRHRSTVYWFVRQVWQDAYAVRSVDGDLMPTGRETVISAEKLIANYTPEVGLFEEKMVPSAGRTRYRLDDATFPGHTEVGPRIAVTLGNVRALFCLAFDYLRRGNEKGRRLIEDLLRIKTDFEGKDQHLFNAFGIALRKAGRPDMAAVCYRRAILFTTDDDHLYYNLARANYEAGKWWDCMEALGWSFECNSDLPVSRWLVELTVAMAGDDALRIRHNKPPIPEGVVRRATMLAEAVSLTPMEKPPSTVRLERGRTQGFRDSLDRDVVWSDSDHAMVEVVR